jgi:hypothetical protein
MTSEERRQKIEQYGAGPAQLVEALKEFPREMWQWKPAPDRWSIHEILIHLADSETNAYIRARRLVAEPGKSVMAYDQDVWARELDYHARSTDDALELVRLVRKMTYDMLKTLPDAAWSHIVQHPEHGNYTFDRWLEIYAGHIPGHIAQMKRNFEAWQKSKP